MRTVIYFFLFAFIFSANVSQSQVCTINQLPTNLQNGLVAYYPFCGNPNDVSGNGVNMINNGAVLTNDRFGNANSAYAFDGASSTMTIPYSSALASLVNNFSVSIWIKNSLPAVHLGAHILYKAGDFSIGINGDNTISFASQGIANLLSSNTVLVNTWTHVVYTKSGNTNLVYINGVLDNSSVTNLTLNNHIGQNMLVGVAAAGGYGGAYRFLGSFNQLMFYNRVLTACEVLQLSGGTTNGIAQNPITYNALQDTTKVCGKAYTLDAGAGYSAYLWSTGATSQSISTTTSGKYTVRVTNAAGCTAIDSTYLSIVNANILNNDTAICKGTKLTLSLDSIASGFGKWQTRLPGKEIYNIKKDLLGNLYAIPSWNSDKIYKSIDRGDTWVQLTGFPALSDHNYMALGVDGANNIYASTNHNGMYRSTDNGTTWSNVQDFGFGCGPMDIVFTSPTASVLTVKGYNRGIWYSSNSNSWTQKVGGLDPASITKDIYGNLYASGFYKSVDNGLSWTTLSNAYDGFVVRADSLGNVYTISSPTTSALYKSSNQGATFSQVHPLNFSMTNGAYASDILFTKNAMFVAKGQVFYSNNGGSQFTQLDTISYATANPSGYYSNPTFRMEILGNRLFVATTDGIKFIDLNQGTPKKIVWSTGDTTSSISVAPNQTTKYYVSVSDGITTCQDSVIITVAKVDTSLLLLDPAIQCTNNGQVKLKAAAGNTYQWKRNGVLMNGITSQIDTAKTSGLYKAIITNSLGCIDSTRNVQVALNPIPVAGNITGVNNQVHIDDKLYFNANPQNGTTPYNYFWTLSDASKGSITGQQSIIFKGLIKGTANLSYHVVDANNCISNESTLFPINVLETKLFFVPTAFSPNNDGLNDYLSIVYKPEVISLNYFKVFNRFGNLVFETSNLRTGWDGRKNGVLQDADAFYWIAEYTILGGETLKGSGQAVLIK